MESALVCIMERNSYQSSRIANRLVRRIVYRAGAPVAIGLLALLIILGANVISSPSVASANPTYSKQTAGGLTEPDESTPEVNGTQTTLPTQTPARWESAALLELADALGWPPDIIEDGSGKLSVALALTNTEQARVSLRPFDFAAGAEAAFAAEQEDARLAGLQVTPTVFYSYAAYTAVLRQGNITQERRLHWVVGSLVLGVDLTGVSATIQNLDPELIGRQLLSIAIQHGLSPPPGWVFPTGVPTTGRTPSATPTFVSCGITFSDVDTSHWAYRYISQLACSGVISGYPTGIFKPQNSTTRAQLAKMIVLSEGWVLANPARPTFRDVDGSHLFFRYVETLYAHGVVTGYDNDLFKPDSYVTRAQVAKMLVLARGWSLTVQSPFVLCDVSTTHWAWTYVEVAIQHRAFTGYANGCFYPDLYATRAQLAKVIAQAHR